MTAQKKIDQADWVRYYHKTQTMAMWLINYFARLINRAANTAAAHCTTQLLVVHVYSEPCEIICCHFLLTNNSAMPDSVIDLSEDELPAPIGKRKATDKSSAAKKKSASKIVAIFWRGDLLRRFYSQHFTDGVKWYANSDHCKTKRLKSDLKRNNSNFLNPDNPVIGRFSQPS